MSDSPQPRRKLRGDLPGLAHDLAALGMPLATIAKAAGVHRSTLHRWRTDAAAEGPERALSDAIKDGYRDGEMRLIQQLHDAAAKGDTSACKWLLTHAPQWRDNWSDSAAERRALQAQLSIVVRVIAEANLAADQRDRLLLQLAAAGLSPAAEPLD